MEYLLKKYKQKHPEIVFEWNDQETEAKGWVVINSLRNGAAGGGTRMRKGLTKAEVISLAKVMEIKFSVCGPDIGGAKSGIDFDPNDPRREDVLKRWYKAIFPLLKNYYGTGGDLNVDELKDVIPITEDLGLWHPQEGIVNGHLESTKGDKINVIGQLRYGCAKIVEDLEFVPAFNQKFAIADLITGYGVAQSVLHYYDIFKDLSVKGKRVIIQGWGNVASSAGYYLAKSGASIIAIIDKNGGLINIDGFSFDEIQALFMNRHRNKLAAENMIPFDHMNQLFWELESDVFIPGAASKLVTAEQANSLIANGLELISCGANVPFADDKIFFGPTAETVDKEIAVIPDFIANCGMARVFAYLMNAEVKVTDQDIFMDVSITIKKALDNIYKKTSNCKNLSSSGLELALNSLLVPENTKIY